MATSKHVYRDLLSCIQYLEVLEDVYNVNSLHVQTVPIFLTAQARVFLYGITRKMPLPFPVDNKDLLFYKSCVQKWRTIYQVIGVGMLELVVLQVIHVYLYIILVQRNIQSLDKRM